MKKSQLRNIIRESIKQLINEQPSPAWQSFGLFLQQNPSLAFNWSCGQPDWIGMRKYAHYILSLNNFQSPLPNQPCNFIHQRIQHFTNLLTQAGPNSQNAPIWQCKLNFFNALAQQYNC